MASSAATHHAGSTTTGTEPVDLAGSGPHSLHQAVRARRAEYVRPHHIRVKVGTWNVAACPGTDKDLANWFISGQGIDKRLASLDISRNSVIEREETDADPQHDRIHLMGDDKIGLYVLGLQEVVDLNTATYMKGIYSADSTVADKWKTALEAALPEGYKLVACEQLTGMLLLIYASPEVAPTISNVSTVPIGTGVMGYLGNKGAVSTRLVLGETTRMLFVNCHLASGSEPTYLDRRIWDVGQIISRTTFQPITFSGVMEDDGEKIGDEDFGFWFGDLNFRLDGLPGDDIRRLLMLHTRGEYGPGHMRKEDSLEGEIVLVDRASESSDGTDLGSILTRSTDRSETTDGLSEPLTDPDEFVPDPHEDPLSLQATLDSLLPHDQLLRLMKERKLFHDGWREGPITFLPSYKYDVGTVGLFDSSEKRRAPSWCDRILFRTRKDKENFEAKVKEEEEARKRDEEMKAQGLDTLGEDEEVLFDIGDDQPPFSPGLSSDGMEYEPYDEGDDEETEEVVTKEGFVDRMHLDIYTSHQRVTSSDHKPIVSIFSLEYDAVVSDLKAAVYADVARELDRAENEGRPSITMVVDSDEPTVGKRKGTLCASDHAIDFGEVRFLKQDSCSLTLANTGRVPATFSFVEKPTTEDSESYSPEWLNTSFARSDMHEEADATELGKEVTLEPGETVKAVIEANVCDIQHARLLNDGHATLEEVLVLRVADGRDHFIPVRATWLPTCIGRSLDELIRIPDGGVKAFVKSLCEEKGWRTGTGSVPYDLPVRSAAPKELFKLTELVESLTERALADEQMLDESKIPKSSGWPFEESSWRTQDKPSRLEHIINVIEALDNDHPLADAFSPETSSIERLEIVSEALLLFLKALTDGIVTIPLWARIEQASLPSIGAGYVASKQLSDEVAEDDKTAILDILAVAPNHNISLVFLTSTLTRIIAELSPLTKANLDALKDGSPARGMARKFSFFASSVTATPSVEAVAALEQRKARESRYAEIFGGFVCRSPIPEKEKERKALEDKQRALVELFLRRRDGG